MKTQYAIARRIRIQFPCLLLIRLRLILINLLKDKDSKFREFGILLPIFP